MSRKDGAAPEPAAWYTMLPALRIFRQENGGGVDRRPAGKCVRPGGVRLRAWCRAVRPLFRRMFFSVSRLHFAFLRLSFVCI